MQTITDHPISDIFYIHEPERQPVDTAVASIIGTTDSDNRGISGLEYYWNTHLSGTTGIEHVCHDARTLQLCFTKYTQRPHIPGDDIHTTLDATLEFLIHRIVDRHTQKHHAEIGTTLIMDPSNGDVHAITQATHDPHTSLMPITQTHELGSVMKAFLMAAALEEEVTHPDELIWCDNTRRTTINTIPITTWRADGYMTCADVIRFSNNIGTAKIAQRLGKRIYSHYTSYGFGSTTGIDFPGEQSGHLTPPHRWSLASPSSLSFGYEISMSLIQLARAFSIFANDGHLVQPRLTNPEAPASWSHQILSSTTIAQARDVISIDTMGNTARRGYIPGYQIYGKTGSAHLISDGTYDPTRGIYTFVGLVENGSYQRIIVTCIKEPHGSHRYAATIAVPLFKEIAQDMLIHDHQIHKERDEAITSS